MISIQSNSRKRKINELLTYFDTTVLETFLYDAMSQNGRFSNKNNDHKLLYFGNMAGYIDFADEKVDKYNIIYQFI